MFLNLNYVKQKRKECSQVLTQIFTYSIHTIMEAPMIDATLSQLSYGSVMYSECRRVIRVTQRTTTAFIYIAPAPAPM